MIDWRPGITFSHLAIPHTQYRRLQMEMNLFSDMQIRVYGAVI